jgi:branched-chain amino acid aminotransferase
MKSANLSFGSIDGKICKSSKVLLPGHHEGVLSGYGVYEVFKFKDKSIRDFHRHFLRLKESAHRLNIILPFTENNLEEHLNELAKKNKFRDMRIRVQIYGIDTPVWMTLCLPPWKVSEKQLNRGVAVVSFQGERLLPEVKSINLTLSMLARTYAEKNASFEALLVDRNGYVLEGTRTSLFAYDGKRLITSDEDVLIGITREHIIEAANELQIPLGFEKLKLKDCLDGKYKGLYLASTSLGIVSILSIDRVEIPVHKNIVQDIQKKLSKY